MRKLVAILLLVLLSCGQQTDTYIGYPGAGDACKQEPAFINKYGVRSPWAIDLSQHKFIGLRILERFDGGRVFQKPGWSANGHMVSYTIDDEGNIYLCPAPYVSLQHNPPKKQNKVYKLDSESGKVSEFINLPKAAFLNSENPFGSFGLAYDCETSSIYVSSLAGSDYKMETGCIYQLNKSGEIQSKFEGVDALGLAVYGGERGKRLYFGGARESQIHSIALDENGGFIGGYFEECDLSKQMGGGTDKGVRLSFENGILQVKAMEFSYSLIASSDPMKRVYSFKEDDLGFWEFVQIEEQ